MYSKTITLVYLCGLCLQSVKAAADPLQVAAVQFCKDLNKLITDIDNNNRAIRTGGRALWNAVLKYWKKLPQANSKADSFCIDAVKTEMEELATLLTNSAYNFRILGKNMPLEIEKEANKKIASHLLRTYRHLARNGHNWSVHPLRVIKRYVDGRRNHMLYAEVEFKDDVESKDNGGLVAPPQKPAASSAVAPGPRPLAASSHSGVPRAPPSNAPQSQANGAPVANANVGVGHIMTVPAPKSKSPPAPASSKIPPPKPAPKPTAAPTPTPAAPVLGGGPPKGKSTPPPKPAPKPTVVPVAAAPKSGGAPNAQSTSLPQKPLPKVKAPAQPQPTVQSSGGAFPLTLEEIAYLTRDM